MTIKPLVPSVAVAAAVAAVVTVILPLQSFLGNESLYPFGIGRLSVELGVAFAAATAVFAALFARRTQLTASVSLVRCSVQGCRSDERW